MIQGTFMSLHVDGQKNGHQSVVDPKGATIGRAHGRPPRPKARTRLQSCIAVPRGLCSTHAPLARSPLSPFSRCAQHGAIGVGGAGLRCIDGDAAHD